MDRRNPSDGNEHLRKKMKMLEKLKSAKKATNTPIEMGSKSSPSMPALKGAGGGALAALGSNSAAGGAVQGAIAAGPIGAIAGGALGLVKGIAAQKKKKRELKAQSIREQGANIQSTAKEKNKALQSIMDGLRAAFL